MTILKENNQIIFVGHHGNRISWKLTASKGQGKYRLLFEKFDRTQVTRDQRKQGLKAKRILLNTKTYYFTTAENIDTQKLPCPVLGVKFLNKLDEIKQKEINHEL